MLVVERARRIDEIRHLVRRQDRPSVDQHDMEPDAQAGRLPGPGHRIGRRRRRDHQAGASQDTVAMGGLDGLVDGWVETEIVGADDQSLQLAICRSRRKWKNSTPSRRRRFIIVGLRTISLTIEAIFPARK